MLYQIQYPVWKSKVIWPLLTWFSRYSNFCLSVVIFCFSIYYQVALIWLIFLIIYLLQAWSVSSLHNKYMVEQFDQFKPTHATRSRVSLYSRSSSIASRDSITLTQDDPKKVYVLTEQEVLKEYETFNLNVHKTSL